jgi:hypothetical protein
LVDRKINKFTKAWSRKGITREDFYSIFWETAWKVTEAHTFRDDYFLYKKIPQALESAGIDFIRACFNTDKRKSNYNSVSYKDISSFRFEGEVETKIMVEQCCEGIERDVLKTYLECPNLPYTEIGRLHGIDHHQKVKRVINSALDKIKKPIIRWARKLFGGSIENSHFNSMVSKTVFLYRFYKLLCILIIVILHSDSNVVLGNFIYCFNFFTFSSGF